MPASNNSGASSPSSTRQHSPLFQRKNSLTQSDILRSRIDEQSNLICVLKQRNDQLLAKVNAAENQNEKLIASQAILKQQLHEDNSRFERLEDHFNTLAKNHQEMIDIKDEYKRGNESLTRDNLALKNQLHSKESNKVAQLSHEIKSLQETLKIETDLLTQQRDINHSNQTKLLTQSQQIQELKSAQSHAALKQKELASTVDGLKSQKSVLENEVSALKKEQNKLVNLNMRRGELLAKLERENASHLEAADEAKREIKRLKRKWQDECDKIDVNYRVTCLLEEIDNYKLTLDELETHKCKLKNDLVAEKQLNQRLRQYK